MYLLAALILCVGLGLGAGWLAGSRCWGQRSVSRSGCRSASTSSTAATETSVTTTAPSLGSSLAHNMDAIVASWRCRCSCWPGWPLEGWFWAVALWAVNRFLQALVERRAAQMTRAARRRHDGREHAAAAVDRDAAAVPDHPRRHGAGGQRRRCCFLVLVTVDIGTRIAHPPQHRRADRRDADRDAAAPRPPTSTRSAEFTDFLNHPYVEAAAAGWTSTRASSTCGSRPRSRSWCRC